MATAITSRCSSSATAAATAGPSSAAATITSTTMPKPLPPLWPWVWAPSGIPMTTVLLVSGGGLPPVADPEHEPVNDARASPLDAPAALAPRAHGAAAAALDVPAAIALGAAAERGQVQEPHPQRDDGEHGRDEMRAHRSSPVAAGRAGGVPGRVAI